MVQPTDQLLGGNVGLGRNFVKAQFLIGVGQHSLSRDANFSRQLVLPNSRLVQRFGIPSTIFNQGRIHLNFSSGNLVFQVRMNTVVHQTIHIEAVFCIETRKIAFLGEFGGDQLQMTFEFVGHCSR